MNQTFMNISSFSVLVISRKYLRIHLQWSWENGLRSRKNTADPIPATLTGLRSDDPFTFSLAKSWRRSWRPASLRRHEKKLRGRAPSCAWSQSIAPIVWSMGTCWPQDLKGLIKVMVFVLILRGKDYEYNERNKPLFNKVFKFDVNINIIFYNNLFCNIL